MTQKITALIEAVEKSEQAKTEAVQVLQVLHDEFDVDSTPERWKKIKEANADLEFKLRLRDAAIARRDAAVQAEAERVAAQNEVLRVAASAEIEKYRAEVDEKISKICGSLVRYWQEDWEKMTILQNIGGATQTRDFVTRLNVALGHTLQRNNLPTGVMQVR